MFGFDFISKFFGYALGYLFEITGNYGTAVILFTLIVCVLSFPLSVKKYCASSPNLRFEAKKEALKKQCGKDIRRFEHEQEELAKKEGVNPLAGCMNLSMIFTFIIFGGVYSTIQRPLSNVLHLSEDAVSEATGMLNDDQRKQKGTDQLDIVRSFDDLRPKLTMFSDEELNDISKLSSGFNFLGINLLNTPKSSNFSEMLWIFPFLSLIFSVIGTYVIQKNMGTTPDEQVGFAKYAIYLPSLLQVWFAYRVFAAVGICLIANSFFNIFQSMILEHFFSPFKKIAKQEQALFDKISS